MSEAPATIAAVWSAAEQSFFEAAQHLDGEALAIFAHSGGPGSAGAWQAFLRQPDRPAPSFPAIEAAGTCFASLAATLRLIRQPEAGIVEYAAAELDQDGNFLVFVRSVPPEEAFARLLIDASAAADFIASRTWGDDPRSPWDLSCRRRLVRTDHSGSRCVIEPGAVWFVEWFEQMGAQTIFSCEGHPAGFHVVFRAPYELAHAIAGAPYAIVEIFRSGAFPQAGQWRLCLRREPETRESRDPMLRRLTEGLIDLGVLETLAPS